MEPQPELLPLYLELIEVYGRQGERVQRDAFVLLAAEAYLASGQEDEAEYLFADFSGRNPGHVLVLAGSLTAAMHDPQASNFLNHLRKNYPEDVVRDLVKEARVRRGPFLPVPRSPEAANHSFPVTQPVTVLRQTDPPPGRGPGNPVPAPRPQPTLPPRRDPTPAPVRPQPVPARPAPTTPGGPGPQRRHDDESESAGVPVINFLLFLLLIAASVFLAAWTLLRPFLP